MAEASHSGAPPGAHPGETAQPPGANSGPTPSVGRAADYLEIKTEPMKATLLIKNGIRKSGIVLTKLDIEKKLSELGIVFGIEAAAIEKMLAEKVYDKAQVVAVGKTAKLSRDAYIEEKIKIDPNLDPVLGKDGKADYKNVDNIHQVKKGDVIAVKHPFVPPEVGSDIFGKSPDAKAPPPPKDAQFRIGTNTEVTADGSQLVATVGGYVYHQTGTIHVGVTYILKGDVDFHTGNLHYQGDIQVLGSVTSGFIVEAQGNVIIEGNVDAADVISHGGDVTIKSAIFGHGHGRIEAAGNISVQSAQDVTLVCENGTISVDKALLNCNVTALRLKADAPGCLVMGGNIKAFADVSVANLGGEGCSTRILIVDKEADLAKQKVKIIDKELTAFLEKLEPVEKRLKNMKTMAAKFGGTLSDRMRADLKLVLDHYTELKNKEKKLVVEKDALTTIVKAIPKHIGRIMLMEKVVWGASIELYGHHHELLPEDAHKEWNWAPMGLTGMSLLPEEPKVVEEAAKPEGESLEPKAPHA